MSSEASLPPFWQRPVPRDPASPDAPRPPTWSLGAKLLATAILVGVIAVPARLMMTKRGETQLGAALALCFVVLACMWVVIAVAISRARMRRTIRTALRDGEPVAAVVAEWRHWHDKGRGQGAGFTASIRSAKDGSELAHVIQFGLASNPPEIVEKFPVGTPVVFVRADGREKVDALVDFGGTLRTANLIRS